MILTLTASIMLWSLANKDDKKEASAAMGKWNDAVKKIEVINKFVTSPT
jgi:plastin-1